MTAEQLEIQIRLPLPIDVTSAIGLAFDQMWPGCTLVTGEGRPNGIMHIQIPRHRALPVDLEPVEAGEPDEDVNVLAIEGRAIAVEPSERIAKVLAGHLLHAFDQFPDAPNYVEMRLIDPATSRLCTVTIHTPDGKSAHELRREAEAHVADLERRLREAGIEP